MVGIRLRRSCHFRKRHPGYRRCAGSAGAFRRFILAAGGASGFLAGSAGGLRRARSTGGHGLGLGFGRVGARNSILGVL